MRVIHNQTQAALVARLDGQDLSMRVIHNQTQAALVTRT
jgi:hypothetical protein